MNKIIFSVLCALLCVGSLNAFAIDKTNSSPNEVPSFRDWIFSCDLFTLDDPCNKAIKKCNQLCVANSCPGCVTREIATQTSEIQTKCAECIGDMKALVQAYDPSIHDLSFTDTPREWGHGVCTPDREFFCSYQCKVNNFRMGVCDYGVCLCTNSFGIATTLPSTTPSTTSTTSTTTPTTTTTNTASTTTITANVPIKIYQNVSISQYLSNGYSVVLNRTYSYPNTVFELQNEVLQKCTIQSEMCVAGASMGSSLFSLISCASCFSVLATETPNNQTVYRDGAFWYFNSFSFGFSPLPSFIQNQGDSSSPADPLRLSWHTSFGQGGYRLGTALGLNSDTTRSKIVLINNPK